MMIFKKFSDGFSLEISFFFLELKNVTLHPIKAILKGEDYMIAGG
jgi:hypothetical protein